MVPGQSREIGKTFGSEQVSCKLVIPGLCKIA
jgi:hypothetical protein